MELGLQQAFAPFQKVQKHKVHQGLPPSLAQSGLEAAPAHPTKMPSNCPGVGAAAQVPPLQFCDSN